MHMAKSLKNKQKKIILYFHITKKISKICISIHFGFNNQFITVTRTRPIFQNFQKKLFCFLLISRVRTLYVRRIPDIKFLLLTSKLPDKIKISLLRKTFLKPQRNQQLENTTSPQILSDNKTIQLTLGRVYLGC